MNAVGGFTGRQVGVGFAEKQGAHDGHINRRLDAFARRIGHDNPNLVLVHIHNVVQVAANLTGRTSQGGKFKPGYCGKRGGPLELDHFKSKKQAWDEGAYNWTDQERNEWSNNEENLLTTCRTCNAQKGATDPLDWLFMLFTGTKGTGQ